MKLHKWFKITCICYSVHSTVFAQNLKDDSGLQSEQIGYSVLLNYRVIDRVFIENHIANLFKDKLKLSNSMFITPLFMTISHNRFSIDIGTHFNRQIERIAFHEYKLYSYSLQAHLGYIISKDKFGYYKTLLGIDNEYMDYRIKDLTNAGLYNQNEAGTIIRFVNLGIEYRIRFENLKQRSKIGPILGLRVQYKFPLVTTNWGLNNSPSTKGLEPIYELGLNIGFISPSFVEPVMK